MNALFEWLFDPTSWHGHSGIIHRMGEHLLYSVITVAVACLIAIPLGLWIGHTGRGRIVVVNLVNGIRSLPTLGILFIAVLLLGPLLPGNLAFLVPSILVLVVLAVPPILAGTYSGVDEVDPAARDAARGMGMKSMQRLLSVELPCALPLIFSGIRSSMLQVIATATIAASVSIGGLGRYLIDGLAVQDYGEMAGGALLVAVLAVLVDAVLAIVQRTLVSPGLRSTRLGMVNRRFRARVGAQESESDEPSIQSAPADAISAKENR